MGCICALHNFVPNRLSGQEHFYRVHELQAKTNNSSSLKFPKEKSRSGKQEQQQRLQIPELEQLQLLRTTRNFLESDMEGSNNDAKTNSGNSSYPQLSDLIFNNASNNSFNKVLGELKRSTLSIPNRLRSIKQDANFVSEVAAAYELPLVANERCGSWYISPEQKKQSAYFKSTDGHMAQWSFSLRRLNLQVLETIGKFDGYVVLLLQDDKVLVLI